MCHIQTKSNYKFKISNFLSATQNHKILKLKKWHKISIYPLINFEFQNRANLYCTLSSMKNISSLYQFPTCPISHINNFNYISSSIVCKLLIAFSKYLHFKILFIALNFPSFLTFYYSILTNHHKTIKYSHNLPLQVQNQADQHYQIS